MAREIDQCIYSAADLDNFWPIIGFYRQYTRQKQIRPSPCARGGVRRAGFTSKTSTGIEAVEDGIAEMNRKRIEFVNT